MALVFPTNPIDGQLFDRYIYNGAKEVWDIVPDDVFPYYVGPTKPTSPKEGMGWFNTENAQTYIYYDDGVGALVTRTNLCTNPGAETSISGWWQAQRSTSEYYSGTASIYTTNNSTEINFDANNVGDYTISAWVKAPTATSLQISIPSWGSYSAAIPINQTWQRVSFTANFPSGQYSAVFDANSPGLYIDNVLIEQSSTLESYFDGSTPGASWTGTANLSTSTLSVAGLGGGQWVATSGALVVPNSNTIAALDDTTITTPADGDVVSYDTATSSWVNRNLNNDFVRLNPKTISETLTIPSGYNGTSAGPLTIADGVTVTIADGSAWSIV